MADYKWPPEGGTGTITGATNLGTGDDIYAGTSGTDLEFKTLAAGTHVTIDDDGSTLTINANTGGGGGNVSGPGSSTDNAVARWNGTAGTDIQNSAVIISDTNDVSGVANLNVTGTTTLNTGLTGVVHAVSGVLSASTVVNADVSGSAAIAVSKLAALTTARAVVTDGSGFISAATTTATEIGYVNGVTSAIQTQLNGKQASGNYITALTGDVTAAGPGSVAATLAATSNATLTTLSGLTSAGSLATVGTITTGTWNGTAVDVQHGGTGRATLTNHGVLIGAGTSAITQLAAAGGGTILGGVASSDPAFTQTPTLGLAGVGTGTLGFSGTTSGTVTIQPQAAAGTYNFNLPITAGSSGQGLTSGGGGSTAMTWTTFNPMTTGGDIIYGGGSGAPTRLANGSSGNVLQSAGGTSAPTWATLKGNTTALGVPTVQRFTSGSGTYTTPTSPGPLYLIVELLGGGGGAGSGTATGTAATDGGNTTFGASLTAAGGVHAVYGLAAGGAGGLNTISTGTTIINAPGADGGPAGKNAGSGAAFNPPGACGGNSFFGGAGQGGIGGNVAGVNAQTNSGGGGGGGSVSLTANGTTGAGGGGAAYMKVLITSPAVSYNYAVGAAGSGGAAGTSGSAGGNGGAGMVVVTEYYQ